MKHILIFIFILSFAAVTAQQEDIRWLRFNELEDHLQNEPKPVMIYFYTDWCVFCKKMDNVVFSQKKIINKLNEAYYAVKFNAESTEVVIFGNKKFTNQDYGKKRMAYHQIPKYLLAKDQQPLQFPGIVILNSNFEIEKRFYRYIAPKEMTTILNN